MRLSTAGMTAAFVLVAACRDSPPDTTVDRPVTDYPTIGDVVRLDPELDRIVEPGTAPQLLATGFNWSEGPVWIDDGDFLLFSDVPENTIYRWAEGDTATTVFIRPSGRTTNEAWAATQGSNGLTLDASGYLVVAQHGDRRVARMLPRPGELGTDQTPTFETIADRYDERRLNSPNDVVFGPDGSLYFTDPPYGLPGGDESRLRELEHNGVFRVTAGGDVELLDGELSRPNGIAFSPDGATLYVANSDPERALWMAYDVTADGSVTNRRVFFDATAMVPDAPGLPDGLKVSASGYLFATGPGGVLVLSPDGRHLGTIRAGLAVANCAFGPNAVLYMTSDDHLARTKLVGGL